MKRRKLKYKNIGILLGIIIVIIITITLIFKKDYEIKFKINYINYGEEFTIDMIESITYKGKNIKNDITLQYDKTKIGNIDIIIKYDNKEMKKKIKVIDNVKPDITIKGGDQIIIKDNEYVENGYTAIDNYDGDITSKVVVDNKIDITKDGDYEVIYTVKDISGNQTSVKRKVTVTSISPIDMSVKDFNLDGYYTNNVLKSTDMQDDSYLKDIIFAGDSIPLYYGEYSAIKGTQIWNKNGINPETTKTNNININYGNDGEMLLVDAYKKYQPKMTIITLGSNSAGWMKIEYFISEYKSLIENIKKVSPNTKIIIQSIPPVDISLDRNNNSLNNKKINTFNFYLLKMCNEMDLMFLNSAIALKDENGTCKESLCRSDGIHQSKEGIKALVLYTKSHAIID